MEVCLKTWSASNTGARSRVDARSAEAHHASKQRLWWV